MADKFPGPYQNSVRENDPIMKRVNQDSLEIGARASGMPKDAKSEGMSLDHVGGGASGNGSK